MSDFKSRFILKKRLERKAQKQSALTALTNAWLKAEKALTALITLHSQHELDPVCLESDLGDFMTELTQAQHKIENLKFMIKRKDKQLRNPDYLQ